jgi:hypothetical protein
MQPRTNKPTNTQFNVVDLQGFSDNLGYKAGFSNYKVVEVPCQSNWETGRPFYITGGTIYIGDASAAHRDVWSYLRYHGIVTDKDDVESIGHIDENGVHYDYGLPVDHDDIEQALQPYIDEYQDYDYTAKTADDGAVLDTTGLDWGGLMYVPHHHLFKMVQFSAPWIHRKDNKGEVARAVHNEWKRRRVHSKIIPLEGQWEPHSHDVDSRITYIYLVPDDLLFIAPNNAYHNDIFNWLHKNYPEQYKRAMDDRENGISLGFVEYDPSDSQYEARTYWAEGAPLPPTALDQLSHYFGLKVWQRDWEYPQDIGPTHPDYWGGPPEGDPDEYLPETQQYPSGWSRDEGLIARVANNELVQFILRAFNEGLANGVSWGHLARDVWAQASARFPDATPQEIDNAMLAASKLAKTANDHWDFPPGDYDSSWIYQNGKLHIGPGGHSSIWRANRGELDKEQPMSAGWIFTHNGQTLISFYSGALQGYGNRDEDTKAWQLLQERFPGAVIWSNEGNDTEMYDPEYKKDLWFDSNVTARWQDEDVTKRLHTSSTVPIVVAPSSGRGRFFRPPAFGFLYWDGTLYVTRGHHPDIVVWLNRTGQSSGLKAALRSDQALFGWYYGGSNLDFGSANYYGENQTHALLMKTVSQAVFDNMEEIQGALHDDDQSGERPDSNVDDELFELQAKHAALDQVVERDEPDKDNYIFVYNGDTLVVGNRRWMHTRYWLPDTLAAGGRNERVGVWYGYLSQRWDERKTDQLKQHIERLLNSTGYETVAQAPDMGAETPHQTTPQTPPPRHTTVFQGFTPITRLLGIRGLNECLNITTDALNNKHNNLIQPEFNLHAQHNSLHDPWPVNSTVGTDPHQGSTFGATPGKAREYISNSGSIPHFSDNVPLKKSLINQVFQHTGDQWFPWILANGRVYYDKLSTTHPDLIRYFRDIGDPIPRNIQAAGVYGNGHISFSTDLMPDQERPSNDILNILLDQIPYQRIGSNMDRSLSNRPNPVSMDSPNRLGSDTLASVVDLRNYPSKETPIRDTARAWAFASDGENIYFGTSHPEIVMQLGGSSVIRKQHDVPWMFGWADRIGPDDPWTAQIISGNYWDENQKAAPDSARQVVQKVLQYLNNGIESHFVERTGAEWPENKWLHTMNGEIFKSPQEVYDAADIAHDYLSDVPYKAIYHPDYGLHVWKNPTIHHGDMTYAVTNGDRDIYDDVAHGLLNSFGFGADWYARDDDIANKAHDATEYWAGQGLTRAGKVATEMTEESPASYGQSFFCFAYVAPPIDKLFIDGYAFHSNLFDDYPELRDAIRQGIPSVWGQVDLNTRTPTIEFYSDWMGGGDDDEQTEGMREEFPNIQDENYWPRAKKVVMDWLHKHDKIGAAQPEVIKSNRPIFDNVIWIYDYVNNRLYMGPASISHASLMGEMKLRDNHDLLFGWTSMDKVISYNDKRELTYTAPPEVMEVLVPYLKEHTAAIEPGEVTFDQFNHAATVAPEWSRFRAFVYDGINDKLYMNTDSDVEPFHPFILKANPELRQLSRSHPDKLYFGSAVQREGEWQWSWGSVEEEQGSPALYPRAEELLQERMRHEPIESHFKEATEIVEIHQVNTEDSPYNRTKRIPFVYSPQEDKLYIGPYGAHHHELIFAAFQLDHTTPEDWATEDFSRREQMAMVIEDDPGNLGIIAPEDHLIIYWGEPDNKTRRAITSVYPGFTEEVNGWEGDSLGPLESHKRSNPLPQIVWLTPYSDDYGYVYDRENNKLYFASDEEMQHGDMVIAAKIPRERWDELEFGWHMEGGWNNDLVGQIRGDNDGTPERVSPEVREALEQAGVKTSAEQYRFVHLSTGAARVEHLNGVPFIGSSILHVLYYGDNMASHGDLRSKMTLEGVTRAQFYEMDIVGVYRAPGDIDFWDVPDYDRAYIEQELENILGTLPPYPHDTDDRYDYP